MLTTVFKPYPYVFNKSLPVGGLGLSSPGGILWPLYPPTGESEIRLKEKIIPVPPLLGRISFSSEYLDVDQGGSVSFSFLPNIQRFLGNSGNLLSFMKCQGVYYSYENAKVYSPDTTEVNLVELGTISPIIYFVWSYNGNGQGLDEAVAFRIPQTSPFPVILTTSGSITTNIEKNDNITTLSFNRLILKVKLKALSNKSFSMYQTETQWLFDHESDWSVTVSSIEAFSPGPTIVKTASLNISVPIIAISHPENMGHSSFYWGGLCNSFNQSSTLPVKITNTCQSVLGPSWLPHTTFYPLVDLAKTPLSRVSSNVVKIADLESRNEISGYGIIERSMRNTPPEIISSSSLLLYPSNDPNRINAAYTPDYVDTRIINDNCIYPIVGKEDDNRLLKYWEKWSKMTSSLYFQK